MSTLLSRGAPNLALQVPLFEIDNLRLLTRVSGLHSRLRPAPVAGLGPAFLAAAGLEGLALFFSRGPEGDALSGTGVEHTVETGLGAICFLLALGSLWRGLARDPRSSDFERFTLDALVAGVFQGGAAQASLSTRYAGLAERLSIDRVLEWTEGRPSGCSFERGARKTAEAARPAGPLARPGGTIPGAWRHRRTMPPRPETRPGTPR